MHNYDPKKVVVTFGGVLLQGYASGTFIVVEETEDAFGMEAGAGGDVVRVRNNNETGTITVTLQAESPTNDLLSALSKIDRRTGLGYKPIMVKNLFGTTLANAAEAWVRKSPNAEYATEAGSREWVFDCAKIDVFIGGAVV